MPKVDIPDLWREAPKNLGEARILHTRLLCRLWAYAESEGILLRHEEGFVASPRLVWLLGWKKLLKDAVHMSGSKHHDGVAMDHTMLRHGADENRTLYPVTNGSDPAWRKLGEYWESLHPLARWGGRFPQMDSNHFSLLWGGIA